MDEQLKQSALEYHRRSPAGKISILPTKQLTNQRDLALAYSPGVAAACEEIKADPARAFQYTARANLIAVVTNGTAVLGLGAIGPLAAKPVMEGKAVLFKKFAGIDCFDIELDERDPQKLVDIIAALEPTFGAINLEDIKAPECFTIERALRKRMKIPVFHDDQHGTAIIVGAAFLNGLKVIDKKIEKIKLVVSGAGAAALACLDERHYDVIVCDLKMPKVDGMMFFREVSARMPAVARRIIFVTGDVAGTEAERFLEESGCRWIPKPFRLRDLVRIVRETLVARGGEVVNTRVREALGLPQLVSA